MASLLDRFLAENRLKNTDYLGIGNNSSIERLFQKFSDGSRDPREKERVYFSDFIVKINPRDKPQERVLMITNKAIYNLLPTDYSKCKRRIPLQMVDSITVSQISDEFVIHVPSEYDYRMMSLRKMEVVSCVDKFYTDCTRKKLKVDISELVVLKELCVTRTQAKKMKKDGKTRDSVSSSSSFQERKAEEPGPNTDIMGWGKEHTPVTPEDFNLLRVIGRGSFGKVMLVSRKDNPERTYAMKILRKEAIIERNQVEHTKAERKILEEMKHPFLMSLHFAFQSKTKLYMVMDYLKGGELFFHLKNQRRFNESRACFYAAEITLGLGHLHSLNIIYRDLKPENILLDDAGHIRLTDFGLSKKYLDGKKALTFCGTPEYLAPEVISGDGHGKEVDWWSLGILIFEMVVGLPPFYSENVNRMYEFIQHADLKIPKVVSGKRISECTRTIIKQLLRRSPKRRLGYGPDDVEEVKQADFFHHIDWEKLYNLEVSPEFVPKVKGDTDTSNFDSEFTNEKVVDSYIAPNAIIQKADFKGFTYQEASGIGQH